MARMGTGLRRSLASAIGIAAITFALWRLLPGETDVLNRWWCASIALSIAAIIAVATGRIGFGLLVAGALTGAVWLAGTLKLAYLHVPLLAPDLRYFTGESTAEVIAHYPALCRKIMLAIAGGLALLIVAWRLETPSLWRGYRMRTRTVALLLALGLPVLLTWSRGPFASVHAVTDWDFISHAERNPTTAFLRSLVRMRVHVPDYAPDAANAFDWHAPAPEPATTQRPDMVAVLEESTLDPRQWSICNVPVCTFPLFDGDEQTRAHGMLKVHTYGGATWTSEYAFLTGLPHTLFGPAGLYAPYNLAPRTHNSLARQLKSLGYRTIAIYPMPRSFVHAADAYADYGFDEFVDAQDLDLRWESTDADLMRGFETVFRRERAKDDRPLFFMVLTMRQHGPHDEPLDALPAPWNKPPLPGFDERINRNLGNYLFRLHQSSDAIMALRRSLFDAGRPVVLAQFGDHHPSFDGLEMKLSKSAPAELQAEAYAITYYRVDANFDGATFAYPRPLDIGFLAGLMLDVAGLPKDAYFEANTRFRERCEGRFDDCPNRPLLDSYLAYAIEKTHVFAK